MFLRRSVGFLATLFLSAGLTGCSSKTFRDINYGGDAGRGWMPEVGAAASDAAGAEATGSGGAGGATSGTGGAPGTGGSDGTDAGASDAAGDDGGDAADVLDNG
jgi:hypothetical protein